MGFSDVKKYILLDDDIALTTSWELEATQADVELMVFNDVEEFQKVIEKLDKSAMLCIDLNLNHSASGLDVAIWSKKKGFKRVFIITGDISLHHMDIEGIDGILGKYPPFC